MMSTSTNAARTEPEFGQWREPLQCFWFLILERRKGSGGPGLQAPSLDLTLAVPWNSTTVQRAHNTQRTTPVLSMSRTSPVFCLHSWVTGSGARNARLSGYSAELAVFFLVTDVKNQVHTGCVTSCIPVKTTSLQSCALNCAGKQRVKRGAGFGRFHGKGLSTVLAAHGPVQTYRFGYHSMKFSHTRAYSGRHSKQFPCSVVVSQQTKVSLPLAHVLL